MAPSLSQRIVISLGSGLIVDALVYLVFVLVYTPDTSKWNPLVALAWYGLPFVLTVVLVNSKSKKQ